MCNLTVWETVWSPGFNHTVRCLIPVLYKVCTEIIYSFLQRLVLYSLHLLHLLVQPHYATQGNSEVLHLCQAHVRWMSWLSHLSALRHKGNGAPIDFQLTSFLFLHTIHSDIWCVSPMCGSYRKFWRGSSSITGKIYITYCIYVVTFGTWDVWERVQT